MPILSKLKLLLQNLAKFHETILNQKKWKMKFEKDFNLEFLKKRGLNFN